MKTSRTANVTSRMPTVICIPVMLAVFTICDVAGAASIRFLAFNDEVASRKIGVQDSKSLTELEDLNPKKRSKIYLFDIGDTPLALVALDRERPNGKASSVDVILPADMKSPLVMIFPDSDQPSGMRSLVVEDDGTGFPWGSIRFMNTSDQSLMIRCEKETLAVPKAINSIDIIPGGEARNIGVQIFAEAEPDSILYSSVWEHDPNLRKIVFIVPPEDPASKELALQIIPQDKRSKD